MAYLPRDFHHLFGGGDTNGYTYKTTDHVSEVLENGYFRSCGHARDSDFILIFAQGCAPFWAVVKRPTHLDVSLIQPGSPFTNDATDEWNALRTRAKKLGINTYAKSREVVEKELKEAVTPREITASP